MQHIPSEFDDIRSRTDAEIRPSFKALLHDRLFMRVLRGFVPWLPVSWIRAFLQITFIGVNSALGFQKRYMLRAMHLLMWRTTKGVKLDHSALRENEQDTPTSPTTATSF